MAAQTVDLRVQIVRFVLDHQPPIVACEVVDADGRRHTFIDKVLIFLDRNLDADSEYPQAGAVQCVVLDRWCDTQGRKLVRINTAVPDSVESTEGLSEFVVLQTQISVLSGLLP
jgi:hypothetical protein